MKLPDYRLDPPEPKTIPECPYCGSTDYADVYKRDGAVCGCDVCLAWLPAEEWWYELSLDDELEAWEEGCSRDT